MNGSDIEAGTSLKALEVPAGASGRRLDQWLAEALGPETSRSRVQQLIRSGHVSIGRDPVLEPNRRITEGERIALQMPEAEPAEPRPEPIPLQVLYEDGDLIVVVKPAGLVVHPAPGNWSGTLVNALLHHCGSSLSGIGGVRRPGVVHRLDKDTSGVMVAAKTDRAHRALADAFADHGRDGDLERLYLALAWGVPERATGTIDAALGRAAVDRTLRAVVPADRIDARRAITHYAMRERFPIGGADAASLLECRLETGRTHQIRVHLAHIGHPVIGDPDYGQGFRTKANRLPGDLAEALRSFPRQALHAAVLGFRHPVTREALRFEAPLPADMAELVERFRVGAA